MSITTAGVRRVPRGPLRPVRDALAVAERNLIAYRRVPQLLVFSTIQPVIFVLLFTYVFGGAVQSSIPGIPYVDYLMPGIFVQTTVFGAIGAAVGFLVGFRIHTGALAFVAGMLLVLLFGYVMSWIFATVGLAVGDPETAQAAAFPVMAPLVFASSAFVPVSSMPSWLQPFAEHQPVSVTASAVRALMIGGPTTSYVLQSLAWCVGILLVFVPVAVRRYRRSV